MEKSVRITIKGTQKAYKEEPQVIEFITRGTLQRFGAKLRISYEESELIGTNGVVSTFEIENGRISLERSGKLRARMEFVPGERTESLYVTEAGTLVLTITARSVETDMTDAGGSIHLKYAVSCERRLLSLNTYDIQVEPEPAAEDAKE